MKRRKRMLDDLDSDIQEHIRHEIQDNIDRGMSPEDARTAALRKFGNVARVKQETREVWTVVSLERLLQDIRLSLRILRKTPTFTAVAIVTLALAIGANAMVFSVMNALILRPLNVPDAERLYQLFCGKDKAGNQSFPDYLDLRDRNRSFDDLVACDGAVVGLDTDANPSSAWAVLVTGNYFDGLRLQPYLGRLFHSSDEHGANSAPYIVLPRLLAQPFSR